MRYIGIDYGTKKVGIAQSDVGGNMAFPHSVVPNDGKLFSYICELAAADGATVILGDSRNKDGEENPVAKDIQALGTRLEASGIIVAYEPEWYTSKAAERIQGRTAMTDASAAALILDGFLTRHKHTS